MSIPKVSIIMGVNNGEKYIKKTIDSILNQSFQNFEFIIVLNCSTDRTLDIINEYNDDRIKLYHTNIPQLGFNLNYALNVAKGQYIARIDADDISEFDRIEKQIKVIEAFNLDVVGSNVNFIDENDNFINIHKYPESNTSIRKQICYKSVIAHPSVLYKKEVIINNAAYLGGRTSEDYGLWLRLMRNKQIKFYNIQEPLIKYRIHTGQAKGNSKSYAEVAGLLLTEALVQKNILFFLGSFRYALSSITIAIRR